MKKSIIIGCLLLIGISLQAQTNSPYSVKEIILENGLTVWLNEDHTQPLVFGGVAVKAGAKDCPNTGIAHYFEHMMFKGTDRIGTLDYQAEKVYLDQISAKYDELALTSDDAARKQIQKDINELTIKASKYVIPNEFSNLIAENSGTMLNAGTSYDYTCYFNAFQPAYFEQWCALNSERILNPVFRMFQSELETVYEEKNMYADQLGGQLSEKIFERIFKDHPYSFPIVGSTENLKNPKLSDMRKFFEQYYVASNMVLVLCGDFNSTEVEPIIRKYFSRVQTGTAPKYQHVTIEDFNGREDFEMLLPIPIIKMIYMVWHGPTNADSDMEALEVACNILSNENGTGYLNLLVDNGDFMEAEIMPFGLNDAGAIMCVVAPKLAGMSYEKAEQAILTQVKRIKDGDFSEETVEQIKRTMIQNNELEVEDIQMRALTLMNVFTSNQTLDDFAQSSKRINSITKEDIIRVANKYFTGNYLFGHKSMGNYDIEKMEKPGFDPIVPANSTARSEYAKMLDSIPVKEINTRFIDFEKDARICKLNDNVTLYTTPNPLNGIFSFDIRFGKGVLSDPRLDYVGMYLGQLGTDSLSYKEFNQQLQAIGTTISFSAEDNYSTISVMGPDEYFGEAISVVAQYMSDLKADTKKFSKMISEAKVGSLGFTKDNNSVAQAMLDKVIYGEHSEYLDHMKIKEAKKLKASGLMKAFSELQDSQWNIFYCGRLTDHEVKNFITEKLPIDRASSKGGLYETRPTMQYDKPVVYFFDFKDSKQAQIYSYVKGEPSKKSPLDYATSTLFYNYLCGDMSSLLFQEIREYRSLAYNVGGVYRMPSPAAKDDAGFFLTVMSTQADKTIEAMVTLDSLTRYMPLEEVRIGDALQLTLNDINSDYPSFRDLGKTICNLKLKGYTEDPNKALLKSVPSVTIKEIGKFHKTNIGGNKEIVYIVVGDKSKIDMDALMRFGEVKELKEEDIYRP